jgi:hypothetical protein
MQYAALGLSCKEEFYPHSEDATILLQKEVIELQARIKKLSAYEPVVMRDNILTDHVALMHKIKDIFEDRYPAQTRPSPVGDQLDPLSPQSYPHGYIWSGKTPCVTGDADPQEDYSLRGIIKMELVCEFGDNCESYCDDQSKKAILAIKYALVGGYMASMAWQRFSVQNKQENIVWKALSEHFLTMKLGLSMHRAQILHQHESIPCASGALLSTTQRLLGGAEFLRTAQCGEHAVPVIACPQLVRGCTGVYTDDTVPTWQANELDWS